MTVKGLESLKKKLKALGPATKTEVKAVIQKSADEMVALAKGLAPIDKGALRESIRSGPGRHDLAIEVMAGGPLTTRPVVNGKAGYGYDYDYSLSVEFGTQEAGEQPFFWVSYRSVKRRAKARASRAVRKAARSVIAMGG